MAHEYLSCTTCGSVSRSKDDTSLARLFNDQIDRMDQQACVNRHCPGTEVRVTVSKTDLGGAGSRAMAQKMLAAGKRGTHISGAVTISYVTRTPGVFDVITHQDGRDLTEAIRRLSTGMALPLDVNGRAHFHDGGKYRGQRLPIRDVKDATTYYREWGVLSSSRGWEKNLSSERLVTGATGEIYYTSYHYNEGSWYVFSPFQGRWGKFALRV